MTRKEISAWDEAQWESECSVLMAAAQQHLRPEGAVIILKTAADRVYALEIPDFQDASSREPVENALLHSLEQSGDTEVLICFATISGEHPEIPSWNFRSGLVRINESNLQTHAVLWGYGNVFHVKQFSALLPPK